MKCYRFLNFFPLNFVLSRRKAGQRPRGAKFRIIIRDEAEIKPANLIRVMPAQGR